MSYTAAAAVAVKDATTAVSISYDAMVVRASSTTT